MGGAREEDVESRVGGSLREGMKWKIPGFVRWKIKLGPVDSRQIVVLGLGVVRGEKEVCQGCVGFGLLLFLQVMVLSFGENQFRLKHHFWKASLTPRI